MAVTQEHKYKPFLDIGVRFLVGTRHYAITDCDKRVLDVTMPELTDKELVGLNHASSA